MSISKKRSFAPFPIASARPAATDSGTAASWSRPKTATTVRVRNGKASITDGPFAETKEQLAGFYLLEARDLNEAIQMASRIPPAREGSIEVRPVRQLDVDGAGPAGSPQ